MSANGICVFCDVAIDNLRHRREGCSPAALERKRIATWGVLDRDFHTFSDLSTHMPESMVPKPVPGGAGAIPNSTGSGDYQPVHSHQVGELQREGRRWSRITAIYSNGWDTELVPRREQFWAWLQRRPLR